MCDYPYPQAIRHEVRRARLPHDCISCGFPIMPGEVYDYTSGVWEGEAQDFKRHDLCAVLEGQLRDPDGCGVPFGSLGDAGPLHGSWVWQRAYAVVMRRARKNREAGRNFLGPVPIIPQKQQEAA